VKSSRNVFRDLGFREGEAAHLVVRADLMIAVQKALESRGCAQKTAAALLGVTQPRVSDLVRGRVDLFSCDTLIDMLARLGIGVRLALKPRRRRAA
jgi:predicted XRE-type DNA-binding protein